MLTLEQQCDELTDEAKIIGSKICNDLYEHLNQAIDNLPMKLQNSDMLLFIIQSLATTVIVQNTDMPKEVANILSENIIKMINNINKELVGQEH